MISVSRDDPSGSWSVVLNMFRYLETPLTRKVEQKPYRNIQCARQISPGIVDGCHQIHSCDLRRESVDVGGTDGRRDQ
jgi:hypothetical protein